MREAEERTELTEGCGIRSKVFESKPREGREFCLSGSGIIGRDKHRV